MTKGKGIDIGTMNIVSAIQDQKGKIEYKRIRDAFLDVPINAKKMLKLHDGVSFIEDDEHLLILGDQALEMASVFGRKARRPLQDGLINPNEIGSIDVLAYMLKQVLGEPSCKGEVCYYSIPADPIDQPNRNVIYHKGVFERILTQIGYEAYPSNEAEAIVFSNCTKEGFSGLAFSFGSGMTNVSLVLNTIGCLSFSLARGGDWIDSGVSHSTGTNQARVTQIKESGFDLNNPKDRVEEALSFYYKELIQYSLDWVAKKFLQSQNHFGLDKPIPIVVSGGTSKPDGFVEFFKSVFDRKKKRFPIEISEIRQATDPLNAVAQGMLIQAIQEHEE
jgi:hypothetical protein